MKKHIFCFQVHKEPDLFKQILDRLQAENHYFCVNIDAKSEHLNEFQNILNGIPNVCLVTNFNVMHGGFSQISTTLYQLRFVNKNIADDYYVHTISGQDYPCVSSKRFDAYFENTDFSYMFVDSIEENLKVERQKELHDKIMHFYYDDLFVSPFARRFHISAILRRITFFVHRKWELPFHIMGGWNWFSLSNVVVNYILDFLSEHPEYEKRFHYTFCGDEIFFSTLLYPVADELKINLRNSLRYVEWNPKRKTDSLPLILEETEFDDILQSGAFFCRKIELNRSKLLLDKLDQAIQCN